VTLNAAKWGAELARSNSKEQIYIVEPLGEFENEPNVTDKRFPRNPTRSYRSNLLWEVLFSTSHSAYNDLFNFLNFCQFSTA
jgi:Rifampin ADP-ribosyl transferase